MYDLAPLLIKCIRARITSTLLRWLAPACEPGLSCAGSQEAPPLTVAHCKQSGMEAVSHAVAGWAVSKRANPFLLEIMDSYKEDIEKQLTQGVSHSTR